MLISCSILEGTDQHHLFIIIEFGNKKARGDVHLLPPVEKNVERRPSVRYFGNHNGGCRYAPRELARDANDCG